jgi:hypothetical protein
MADTFYTNFTLDSSNNAFSAVWKLTRAMKKAGWTYKASGNGSTKDTSGTAASDLWGGSVDPSSDTYPAFNSVAAWWCAQGPSTVKVPFTAASTGTFLRGEKITQATSLAEGELLGYDFDGVSTGHIVVLPRTGTFDNSHVITGSSSGATLTPSGTVVEFVRQVVFWKSSANTTSGSVYMQCVDPVGESSSRFSVLATQSGCTSSVAPGGGGTSNAFPTLGSYVFIGAQISDTITHQPFFGISTNMGKAQLTATNTTPATGVSADGTFWAFMGDVTTSISGQLFGFFRVENTEDGDLDPFVAFSQASVTYNSASVRVSSSTIVGSTGNMIVTVIGGTTKWKGWRRRGFSSGDAFAPLATAFLRDGAPNIGGGTLTLDNVANPETVANSYSSKRLRESIWLVAQDNTVKMRKGNPRWMSILQGGSTYDTWDSKTKICVFAAVSGTCGTIVIGPYDGTTTPTQS